MTTQEKLLALFTELTEEEQEQVLQLTQVIKEGKADILPDMERLNKWQKEQEILHQTQAN